MSEWGKLAGDWACFFPLNFFSNFPQFGGKWAAPGGTAIPGQPVEGSEQAPASPPSSKNQFNIEVTLWATYQILS